MKEEILRATNNATKKQLVKLLDTVEQLVKVRREVNDKFNEIVAVVKKSPYGQEPDTMNGFYRLQRQMTWSEKDFEEIETIIASLKESINKKEAEH